MNTDDACWSSDAQLRTMRLDKFLWCVRLCKTRSVAVDACKRGHVQLNDREGKASAEVNVGDRIAYRQAPIWRRFEVVQLPTSRVGAKLIPELIKDITPWEDLEKQEIARKVKAAGREPGAGRPTKRERRDLERFRGE
jgi:ribosome-associated heat shock protein Hsp15